METLKFEEKYRDLMKVESLEEEVGEVSRASLEEWQSMDKARYKEEKCLSKVGMFI